MLHLIYFPFFFFIADLTCPVYRVDVGACLEEGVHTGGARALNGPHEGRAPVEGRSVNSSPGLQQKFNDIHVASRRGMVERCPDKLVPLVHIRPARNRNLKVYIFSTHLFYSGSCEMM